MPLAFPATPGKISESRHNKRVILRGVIATVSVSSLTGVQLDTLSVQAGTVQLTVPGELSGLILEFISGVNRGYRARIIHGGLISFTVPGMATVAEIGDEIVLLEAPGSLYETIQSITHTGTTTPLSFATSRSRGLLLMVDCTARVAPATITPTILYRDPDSGATRTIWAASSAIAGVGLYMYMLYPHAVSGGGSKFTEHASLRLPAGRDLRLTWLFGGGSGSVTAKTAIALQP